MEDITKLAFEIEQRGAADVEQSFRNIENSIAATLQGYLDFSMQGKQSSDDLQKNFQGVYQSLTHLETGIKNAGEAYGGMFHTKQMQTQERRIRGIRDEMDSLRKVMQSGNEEQREAATERLKMLQEVADKEVQASTQVFKAHQEEFNRLVEMKKKSLGELSQEAAKGSATAIQQILSGDVAGAAQTAGGGIQNLGQQAQKRAFQGEMNAGPGGAGNLTKLLGTFAKVAGPLAMAAGAIGMVVKLFLDLDARVKEVNKTMLENVSLSQLASSSYGSFGDQMLDAEASLQEFQKAAMTSGSLRMLGLDPDQMGAVVGAMHEQGLLLSDLRNQGVSYEDALEKAQIAALNLGVDASETAGLIGTLANVTNVSFAEAADSLTQVIAFSKEAGVSTQRFFNTVQGVVGQMGLYNYRIEETAALFTRLTDIMDAESATQFTEELSTAFKNASALERTTTVVVNGLGRVAEMADRTQQRLQEALNPEDLRSGFEAINLSELFDASDIPGSIEKLSRSQRNALQSALRTTEGIDEQTARQFERYRRLLEANRGSVMDMQAVLSDFALGDQIALQIGQLESTLSMPIENMNSVLAESQGVSEDQLRMLQMFKQDMEGELTRLQQAAESGEGFDALAKELGYNMTLEEFREKEISSWTDLFEVMTGEKQDAILEEQQKQTTQAERTAAFQRTLLDTLKFKLLDFVSGIYETLIRLYNTVVNAPIFGGTSGDRARAAQMVVDAEERRRIAELQRLGESGTLGNEDAAELERLQRRVRVRSQGLGESEIHQSEASGFQGAQLDTLMNLQAYGMSFEDAIVATRAGIQTQEGWNQHSFAGANIAESMGLGRIGEASHFKYGDEIVRDFRGLEDENFGRLTKALVNGEWIEGTALETHLAEMVNLSRARDEVDQKIAQDVEEEKFYLGNVDTTLEDTKKILSDSGIEISDSALRRLVQAQMSAQAQADVIKGLQSDYGMSPLLAQQAMGAFSDGDSDRLNDILSRGGVTRQQFEGIVDYHGLRSAGDARIVTQGIPLLNLSAGDIIVDQDALAQTMAGNRGTYVPELIERAARRGGGSGIGGGGGNHMYATFNIYGDNANNIRDKVLRVIQEWERSRSYS